MADQRIRITSNIEELQSWLADIPENIVKKAVARSIKRTTQGANKLTFQEIRDRQLLNTKQLTAQKMKDRRYVRSQTSIGRTIAEMYGIVNIADKRPGMSFFFAKRYVAGRSQLFRTPLYGVKAKIMGKEVRLGKAFLANPNSKKAVVLERTTKARYPLRKLFGPSLAYMLTETGGANRIASSVQGRFEREMDQNLSFFMSKE